ncbi:ggng 1, partial [Biomphalaria pfeifferi]
KLKKFTKETSRTTVVPSLLKTIQPTITMELTIAANLALVSCIYLTLITSPASGYTWKCKGKWFIHACLG